ncbi:MAG: hypothetical protein V1781_01375 [Bacteroidota bacterium]
MQFAISQTITNSPYSHYGLGELQYGGFAHNIAMGGITNALQNDTTAPFYMNFSNPASLASMRLTSFDLGLMNNTIRMETTDKKFSDNHTAISYLAFGFPITKWWGAGFGLLPYSNVGYKIYDKKEIDSIGTVNYSYEGEGGINQFFFGNGFRLKNFSAGVNVSYLFGNLIFYSRDSFPKASNFFNTKIVQTTNIGDLYYTFGMQYLYPLKKNWSLTFGATGSLENNIDVRQTTFAATYQNIYGIELIKDTIINEENAENIVKIPLMLGGGIVIKKGEKLLVGIDYSMQNWSKFNAFGQNLLLKNSQRLAVGFQYIPNKNAGAKESYMKKIFYRTGFCYTDTYLELKNTALKDYAITLGAGFPLRKIKVGEIYSQSIINIGIEIGQQGTTENNLIRERYIKATIGLTLNDRWFIKRKYE